MVFTGLDVNGVLQQHPLLEAQLQATLNIVPAYAWYALPNGALTFVNERTADYLGLTKDHPLRFGTGSSAAWDSHIPLLHADDREETGRVWSTCLATGCADEVTLRVRNAEGTYVLHSETAKKNGGDGTARVPRVGECAVHRYGGPLFIRDKNRMR